MDAVARDTLDRLRDLEEIRRVVLSYARAIDRCDIELLRSMFHPDATESHGGLLEGAASDFCNHAIGLVRDLPAMAHYILPGLIDISGDMAVSESYSIAYHRLSRPDGEWDSIFAGRILDRFARREGAWKIAHRTVVYDWNRDTPASQHWGFGAFGPPADIQCGVRDRSDPIYAMLSLLQRA